MYRYQNICQYRYFIFHQTWASKQIFFAFRTTNLWTAIPHLQTGIFPTSNQQTLQGGENRGIWRWSTYASYTKICHIHTWWFFIFVFTSTAFFFHIRVNCDPAWCGRLGHLPTTPRFSWLGFEPREKLSRIASTESVAPWIKPVMCRNHMKKKGPMCNRYVKSLDM